MVLLALTLAFAGTAAWVLYDDPSDASVEKSLRAAEGTAQTAAPVIFSYDYRRLDDDRDKAVAYMTSDYRQEYDELFAVVEQNAPRLETVVRADLIASGVVRTGGGQEANDRVDVLVVFDQPTTNKQVTEPQRSPAYDVADHGERRRRLAGRRHRGAAGTPIGPGAGPADSRVSLDLGPPTVHHRRQRSAVYRAGSG